MAELASLSRPVQKGETWVRTLAVLSLITLAAGCARQNAYVSLGSKGVFGTDHLEKIALVADHVRRLGLPTTDGEVATILGATYALSQVEGGQDGIPVSLCLRVDQAGDTQFRVSSLTGKPLSPWHRVSALSRPSSGK